MTTRSSTTVGTTMTVRTYSELSRLTTLRERFDYLRLSGYVGRSTFGSDRWINQRFYTSREWRQVRRDVIVRDNGCDLGIDGYGIPGHVYVHHMNPMLAQDIVHADDSILDPEFLITVCHRTHNGIHYSDETQLPRGLITRTDRDHIEW